MPPEGRAAPDKIDALARLTRREREVLDLLAQGLGTREIAKHLDLQEGTIRIYVHRVLRALNVPDRTRAVLQYQRAQATGGVRHKTTRQSLAERGLEAARALIDRADAEGIHLPNRERAELIDALDAYQHHCDSSDETDPPA